MAGMPCRAYRRPAMIWMQLLASGDIMIREASAYLPTLIFDTRWRADQKCSSFRVSFLLPHAMAAPTPVSWRFALGDQGRRVSCYLMRSGQ